MATRILIINRQLVFAVTIKQALEQTGLFDVHPFTTANAAFDFLRDHPQDLALVDYGLPGRSGAKIVQQLRDIQPDLAIIISPKQSEEDIEFLDLQGMIDTPFQARDIIPLIERALNPAADQGAAPSHTRKFSPDSPEAQGQVTTRSLDTSEQPVSKQFGTTRLFNEQAQEANEPAGTNILPDQMPGTRILPEQPSMQDEPAQTHMLGDPPPPPDFVPDESDQFEQPDDSPEWLKIVGQTRDLGDDPIAPSRAQTRQLETPPEQPERSYGTRQLDDFDPYGDDQLTERQENPAPPDIAPEFSSLDEVLKSFGFDSQIMEPPVGAEDTPSVPTKDSDALRQFLATTDPSYGSESFDHVLGAINPDEIEDPTPRRSKTAEFEGLVASLRGDDKHTPLPDRQQQTMDFILTTGMDAVLREIEKTKTGPLPPIPTNLPEEAETKKKKKRTDTFQRLAAEEPPMPTIEESGTVSDLLIGIQDQSFRNVLSLLRGDEEVPITATPREELPAVSRSEMDAAFKDFFNPATEAQQPTIDKQDTSPIRGVSVPAEDEEPASERSQYNFDYLDDSDTDDGATVAQVVLQTALDETQFPQGFSIDRLMSDIEEQLSAHKLNIRPLPSWDMDTSAFRAVIDQAEIREPSFLPEQLPPGEIIVPSSLPEIESKPARPSRGAESWLGDLVEQPADQSYFEETIPSERLRQESQPEEVIADEPEIQPDFNELPDFGEQPSQRTAIEALLNSLAEPVQEEIPWQDDIAATEEDDWQAEAPAVEQETDWQGGYEQAEEQENWQGIAPLAPSDEPAIRASWIDEPLHAVQDDDETPAPAKPAIPSWIDDSFAPAEEIVPQSEPAQEASWIDFSLDQPQENAWADAEAEAEPAVDANAEPDFYISADSDFAIFDDPAVTEEKDESEPYVVVSDSLEAVIGGADWTPPEGTPAVAEIDWAAEAEAEADPNEEAAYFETEPQPQGSVPASPVAQIDWGMETPYEEEFAEEIAPEETEWQPDLAPPLSEAAPAEIDWQTEQNWEIAPEPEYEETGLAPAYEAPVAEAETPAQEQETQWQQDAWDLPQEAEAPVEVEAVPETPLSPEEAYLAQLALNLTQVSLELSAEGTILTRNQDIIAFAGHLSQNDALELKNEVGTDWNVTSEGARLRFVSLPTSGKDYMLYSIKTANNLVLSMVFAGATPLRVIRQQAQRLIDALSSIPEVPAAPPPPTPSQEKALAQANAAANAALLDTYAYVWLLRDPLQRLSDAAIHAINTGLTTQLSEMRWNIQNLTVQDDFVYLLAGIPGEALPHQIISDLQTRSAAMAYSQNRDFLPDSLWADSYLVLTPGREMSIDEIQEFINFQRMM